MRSLVHFTISPTSIMLTTVLLSVLVCPAIFHFGSPAHAQNGGSNQQDANRVTLKNIEDNYGKRFHYAAARRLKDRVVNGRSERGTSKSFPAYTLVKRKCTDKLGTMDERPCDTDAAPVFCAEECLPDLCPPDGKHCPVSPHFNWAQDPGQAEITPPSARDQEALDTGLLRVKGLPMSDTMFQLIDRENKQRFLEHLFDPERWMWTKSNSGQMQALALANSMGGAAEATFASAFKTIQQGPLINVANEAAGVPGGQGTVEGAVYIVQRMYKELFLPMAILLLLPGAILTQVKGLVGQSMLGSGEDSVNPFTGIIRAVIAVFLIPCTQVIVSYCIDAGNVLAAEVAKPQRGWIQEQVLSAWAKEQTFNPDPAQVNNGILLFGQGKSLSEGRSQTQRAGGPSGGGGNQIRQGNAGNKDGATGSVGFNIELFFGSAPDNPGTQAFNSALNFLFGRQFAQAINDSGEGKAAGQLEGEVVQEDQLWLSSVMQVGFNAAALAMGSALNILVAYQLVFMCYLFLMGPIAACFFAWPSGIGGLFKKVFANWLDAVVVLSLWRFWWCVILAVMTQRIIYLQPNPGSPSEMMVYNCFLVLLLYIPFQPFNFNPGPMVTQVLEKAGASGGGGGKKPAVAADMLGITPVAQNSHEVRQDLAVERNLTDIASRRQGQDFLTPHTVTPVLGAPPIARPLSRQDAKPPTGTPGHVTPSVSGKNASDTAPISGPPPVRSGGGTNPALIGVLNQFSAVNVRAIMQGMAPIVSLVPPAEKMVLLNTANSALALVGMRGWQKKAGPIPSYLKDGVVRVLASDTTSAGMEAAMSAAPPYMTGKKGAQFVAPEEVTRPVSPDAAAPKTGLSLQKMKPPPLGNPTTTDPSS